MTRPGFWRLLDGPLLCCAGVGVWGAAAGWPAAAGGRVADAADAADAAAFVRVAAVLEKNCLACHNPRDAKSGLDLSQRETMLAGGDSGPALAAGDPQASLLLRRAREGSMPPINDGPQLGPADLAALQSWIASGAPWPAGRVLQPPRAPSRVSFVEEGNASWTPSTTRRWRRCGSSRRAATRRGPRASRNWSPNN